LPCKLTSYASESCHVAELNRYLYGSLFENGRHEVNVALSVGRNVQRYEQVGIEADTDFIASTTDDS